MAVAPDSRECVCWNLPVKKAVRLMRGMAENGGALFGEFFESYPAAEFVGIKEQKTDNHCRFDCLMANGFRLILISYYGSGVMACVV